jgi:hypothetical protein
VFLIVYAFTLTAGATNQIWCTSLYGKVDPREYMALSTYTNCVLWMPMNTPPTQFSEWVIPDGSINGLGTSGKTHAGQGTANLRPVYTNVARGAMSFDGADDYVIVTNSIALNSSPFTAMAWVKTTVGGSAIISNWAGANATGWFFGIRSTGFVELNLRQTSSIYRRKIGTTTVTNDVWYHLAATADGNRTTNGINLYVNGVRESFTTETAGATPDMSQTAKPYIGNVSSLGATYFKGLLDSLMIFSSEFSSNAVFTAYNDTKGLHP